jgi:hypothetical protein
MHDARQTRDQPNGRLRALIGTFNTISKFAARLMTAVLIGEERAVASHGIGRRL